MDIKGKKRDIIQEYANYGSTVYAPITRDGLSLDKKANKYEVQPEALSTYAGLQELNHSLPASVFKSKINVGQERIKYMKSLTRTDKAHLQELAKAQKTIEVNRHEEEKGEITEDKDKDKNLKDMRPNTPRPEDIMERPNFKQQDSEDQRQRAIILIQRLLRGRAMQNMMFEGKEKRLDLISELRATEEWKQASDLEEEKILIENYQERVLDGLTEGLQSKIIARTIDQLSKELVRFKQQRKIAAMVQLAEDDRKKREAEESGRRQAENILRQREDVLYKELMGVH